MMVQKAMKKASLMTDGSCLGNPGPVGLRPAIRCDYVPPNPQASLFDALDPGDDDEDESDPG